MGREEVIEHDLRYDRADEFMQVVLGHWDTWEDDAIVPGQGDRPLRHPGEGPSPRPRGPFLSLARAVHGAALGAGPSRHHPGRPERARQAFRRAMGRGDLRGLSEYRDRQARLCGFQGGRGALRPRSRARARSRSSSTPSRPRPKPRPRTNGRRSASCRSRSTRCRCCRRRSTSILRARAWTRRSPMRRWRECLACRRFATASCAPAGKRTRRCATSFISAGAAGCITRSSAGPKEVADRLEQWFAEHACDGFVIAATHVPGDLRGLRALRRARAAAPRPLSHRVCRQDLPREPRDPCSAGGRLAQRVLRRRDSHGNGNPALLAHTSSIRT